MVLNFELALVVLAFFAVVAGIYLFWAYVNRGGDRYRERFEEVKGGLERVERALRDDIGKGRTESNEQAHLLRSEVNGSIKNFGEFPCYLYRPIRMLAGRTNYRCAAKEKTEGL